tara:strand:- start:5561 stop:6019 length:459 start_codon:yes stop_codon:yes gene_type:complete
MAAYYSTNYTKQYVNVPSEKIPKGEQYGVMRVAYDDYTFAGDVDLNDTITFMKIPKGARILDVHLVNTGMGGGSIDVGWTASDDGSIAADPDGFFDGYVPTNLEINLSEGSLAGRLKKFDAEGCFLQVKIMHNDVATDTADSIKIMVMYVVD